VSETWHTYVVARVTAQIWDQGVYTRVLEDHARAEAKAQTGIETRD